MLSCSMNGLASRRDSSFTVKQSDMSKAVTVDGKQKSVDEKWRSVQIGQRIAEMDAKENKGNFPIRVDTPEG